MQKYTRIKANANFGFGLGAVKGALGRIGSHAGGALNTIGALSTPIFLAPLFVPGADTKLQEKIQQERLQEQQNEFRLQGIEPPPSTIPEPKPAQPRTTSTNTNAGNVRTTNMNPEMIQRPPMRPNSMR